MAVMTTELSEAFEQKTQPVPSSEEMALDLDINGSSFRNEPKLEVEDVRVDAIIPAEPAEPAGTIPSLNSATAPKILAPATSPLIAAVNGDTDASVHSLSTTMLEPVAKTERATTADVDEHAPAEAMTALSTHVADIPSFDTTITTTTTSTQASSQAVPSSAIEKPESAVESDLFGESALDGPAPSTVPPIVDAPESSLRDEPPKSPQQAQDTLADRAPAADLTLDPAPVSDDNPMADPLTAADATPPVYDAPMVEPAPSDALEPASDSPAQHIDQDEPATNGLTSNSSTSEPPPTSGDLSQPLPSKIPASANEDLGSLPHSNTDDLEQPVLIKADLSPEPSAPSVPVANMDNVPGAAEPSLAGVDVDMVDAPPPQASAKLTREREDDTEEEPSAKRAKTSESDIAQASSGAIHAGQNGNSAADEDDAPLSVPKAKEVGKIIQNLMKCKIGKGFSKPVVTFFPDLTEKYLQIITNPMDLSTVDKKLKNFEYATLGAVKADMKLMVENCHTFNGPTHEVSGYGRELLDTFNTRSKKILDESPPKSHKKVQPKKPTPNPENTRPRRESMNVAAAPPPKKAAAQPAIFAPNPETGVPLIRQNVNNNRPARDIHPPKNRDLSYSSRPMSKKYTAELKFCKEVLTEIKKHKHADITLYFMVPVDPVALGIPQYFQIIKTPMDMSTVEEKLRNGTYTRAKEFEADVRLIVANCRKFNPPGNMVRDAGERFNDLFEKQWARKDRFLASHAPAPQAAEYHSESGESESETEAKPDPVAAKAAADNHATLTARLSEEQAKLIDLYDKAPNSKEMIAMQKQMIDVVQEMILKSTAAMNSKPSKKAKQKSHKKAVPATKKVPPQGKKSTQASGSRGKYMSLLQKEVISVGMDDLPENLMHIISQLIAADQPGVDIDNGEIELDIDSISMPTLWKILDIITTEKPHILADTQKSMEARDGPQQAVKAAPAQKRKNKPMSKGEQERKIEMLKNKQQEFERAGSGSQEPQQQAVLPTVENHAPDESSGDESSDSEEE